MKPMRKPIFCVIFIILLAAVSVQVDGTSKKQDKLELQKKTKDLLDQVDRLSYSDDGLHALFTAQDQKTLDGYNKRYCELSILVNKLSKNLGKWKIKLRESKNDKRYLLYTAAVQTALYSFYSRPHKYLDFLKLVEPSNINCLRLQGNKIHIYENKVKDWGIKAKVMSRQAHANICKALKVDKYCADAFILRAQLYALEESVELSLSILNNKKHKKKELFDDKSALVDSWRAFFKLKAGDVEKGKDFLSNAAAFSSPEIHSKWAGAYLQSLSTTQSLWMEYDFTEFIPLDDIALESLKESSMNFISIIWRELNRPLEEIPAFLSPEKLKRLAKDPAAGVFWDPATDGTDANLKKYARVIETMYRAGLYLEYYIKQWNRLALKNKDRAYYYLMHKSNCALTLVYMAEKTAALLDDKKIAQALQYRPATIKNKKLDYRLKCRQWSQELKDSLEKDIKRIVSQGLDFIYDEILDFEFHALFSSPREANQKLGIIDAAIRSRNIKKLPGFPGRHEMDALSYIYAWKSYLDLKEGKIQSAGDYMNRTGGEMEEWKNAQKKYIRLKTMPATN